LFAAVSGLLVIVFVGFLGPLATAIWWIVRSVKGLFAITTGNRSPPQDLDLVSAVIATVTVSS
jgi:uncharacterized membrane protein